jgi:hypothetical protein
MSEELVRACRERASSYGALRQSAITPILFDRAADTIERLTYDGIHTCHDDCPRLPCVQRREIEQRREIDGLQAALAARNGEIEALHKRIVEQRDEIIRLDLDLCEISKGEDW